MPAGSELVLNVTNEGTVAHDLKLDGSSGTDMLEPGATQTVSMGTLDTSGSAWCTVPGHREAGMELDIVVTGAAPGPAAGGEPRPDLYDPKSFREDARAPDGGH